MRLTTQNLISHTNLHSNVTINNVQNYINSQYQLEANQQTSEHNLMQNTLKDNGQIQTRTKQTRDRNNNEERIKPSGYILDNWSSSDSIPLKARVPKSNKSVTNDQIETETKEKSERKKHPKKEAGKKLKVMIETSKPKSKRKREEEEMALKERKHSIVDREKILNERKEARRKKAATVQDQSIPVHEKLKRESKSKLDSETRNQKRRWTTLDTAIEGLESIPKSKTIKHQGRITIGRSNTFGLFQRTVSSSKLKPTPRKGSGDLVFNELKFLDKKRRIRSSQKSQSPAMEHTSNKDVTEPRDQMTGSESDEVNSQKNDRFKRVRKDLASNSSVRESCAKDDTRTSTSSHSNTANQHSANSLRLRRSGRLTSGPSVKQNSPRKARKTSDNPKQISSINPQKDSKSQEPQETSIHEETAHEEPFVPPRRLSGKVSNFRSTPELPLRTVSVNHMSYCTQTDDSLDRLIMACETDMPVIYDHIAQNLSHEDDGSQVDCHPSSLYFEIDRTANAPQLPGPSSLQNNQGIIDDDDAHSRETEPAEDPFFQDDLEYGCKEEYLFSPVVEAELDYNEYDFQTERYAHDHLDSSEYPIRPYMRSRIQSLEDLGPPQEPGFYFPVVEEELDVDAYGPEPSRYAQHPSHYFDHPIRSCSTTKAEPPEDLDSPLLLPELDQQDYGTLPERNITPEQHDLGQNQIDPSFSNFGSRPIESPRKNRLETVENDLRSRNERSPLMHRHHFKESRNRMDEEDGFEFKAVSAIEGAPPGFEWTASRA